MHWCNCGTMAALLCSLILITIPAAVTAFTVSTSAAAARTTTAVSAVESSQSMILDGGEWITVYRRLKLEARTSQPDVVPKEGRSYSFTSQRARNNVPSFGICEAVTGTSAEDERVVALKVVNQEHATNDDDFLTVLQDGTTVYTESVARIPTAISNNDAVWTMLQSIVSIHCSIPVVTDVSVATTPPIPIDQPKVVVVGSTDDLTARIVNTLSLLECDVTYVATKPNKNIRDRTVQYLEPSVGELDLRFTAVLNEFDSFIDVLGNEHDLQSISTVIDLLHQRHGCNNYVSLQTKAMELVLNDGLLFAPNAIRKYTAKVTKNRSTAAYFQSPIGLGVTIQKLLKKNIVVKQPSAASNDVYIRNDWKLSNFWEYTTWPRDTDTTNLRYGFPIVNDDNILQRNMQDDEEEEDDVDDNGDMISAPPMPKGVARYETNTNAGTANGSSTAALDTTGAVTTIQNIQQLQDYVITPKLNCVVFISAPFCRTCRYIKPQYQRYARNQNTDRSYQFVCAEATGQTGRDLGKALDVDAVPAFVIFRNGQVFSEHPLTISRIPSQQFDVAMSYLQDPSKRTWNYDVDILQYDDDDDNDSRKNKLF